MSVHVFDGHCDTISRCGYPVGTPYYNGGSLRHNSGHLDLERAAKFGGYAQFFACFADCADLSGASGYKTYRQQLERFQMECKKNGDLMAHCRTARQAEEAIAQGKIAAFLSVEGAELLDCDLCKLEQAYHEGVRAVNLTWNHANVLCGSIAEEGDRGLSEQGRAFVKRMQSLGMLVDVSHLSDPGFWDVYELAQTAGRPFFASHSNARAVCSDKRNLTDEQFTAIIKVQGVAGINFCGDFIGTRPTLDGVAAHIEHFCSLGGAKNIALGGDWDGCDLVPGIRSVADLDLLYERLLQLNYNESLVRAVFYDNMMRVVSEVCTTSAQETKKNV